MQSVWEKDLEKKAKEPIKYEISESKRIYEKDVVVVGGGIAGFLCAYLLAENGHKVSLIEAESLFSGVTKNTTAHINALQGKYKDIPTKKKRREYFNSQMNAVEEIERLVNKYEIACDFKKQDSFVFGKVESRSKLKKEFKILKNIGAHVSYLENKTFPFGVFDAIKLSDQAVFNPIKFLNGLPRNFEVIENARIKKVKLLTKELETEREIYAANKIVLATNFPIVNIRGLYAFKMYKSISYAVHIKTNQRVNALFNSIEDDGITYRDTKDGIIVGGLDHRTGRIKTCDKFKQLTERANIFNGEVDAKWMANDCITFDSIPYAGRFGCLKDVYLISGFGKWGMTNGYSCAKVVADDITWRENKYLKLYKPTRCLNITVWHKVLFNAVYNVFNILKSLFCIPFKSYKSLKAGSGGVVWYKGKKRAVYKDETGKEYVTNHMCPHMLCELKFNPNTKTWDCPCHGSRLTANGEIITEPTVRRNVL